jgi:cytochrome c oxidase assembly protein subunit 15
MEIQNTKPLALWLFSVCGLVFMMVSIGAITRLTDSGLSMVEWRPLLGFIPPLNEAEWERVFGLYQQSPEFQFKHMWMGMDDFKAIFFWEWSHRFLGRVIGLAYALPLLVFWLRGMIPSGYKLKLFGLFILGGMQGVLGWYMVKSGLVDDPYVSHYRLAAHLGLAFLIFALMLPLGLKFMGAKRQASSALSTHGWLVMICLILTIFWGAYVAGLDAGLIYNDTFPLMGGGFFPPDMWHFSPWWSNFFENHESVQFTHRWLAMFTVAMVIGYWIHARAKGQLSLIFGFMAMMAVLQMGLGIATLLSSVAIPLATLHQAGALVLLGLTVWSLYIVTPARD